MRRRLLLLGAWQRPVLPLISVACGHSTASSSLTSKRLCELVACKSFVISCLVLWERSKTASQSKSEWGLSLWLICRRLNFALRFTFCSCFSLRVSYFFAFVLLWFVLFSLGFARFRFCFCALNSLELNASWSWSCSRCVCVCVCVSWCAQLTCDGNEQVESRAKGNEPTKNKWGKRHKKLAARKSMLHKYEWLNENSASSAWQPALYVSVCVCV